MDINLFNIAHLDCIVYFLSRRSQWEDYTVFVTDPLTWSEDWRTNIQNNLLLPRAIPAMVKQVYSLHLFIMHLMENKQQ